MTEPRTEAGRWLLDHQGLINIGKIDGSMRGDEIDLRAAIVTIEEEAAALAATGDSGGPLDVERLARALHYEYEGKDSEFGGELCRHREDAERIAARLSSKEADHEGVPEGDLP